MSAELQPCPWAPDCGGRLHEYRRNFDAPSGRWIVFLRCDFCGQSHIEQTEPTTGADQGSDSEHERERRQRA